jgi:hypothetical protein
MSEEWDHLRFPGSDEEHANWKESLKATTQHFMSPYYKNINEAMIHHY